MRNERETIYCRYATNITGKTHMRHAPRPEQTNINLNARAESALVSELGRFLKGVRNEEMASFIETG